LPAYLDRFADIGDRAEPPHVDRTWLNKQNHYNSNIEHSAEYENMHDHIERDVTDKLMAQSQALGSVMSEL
jgi:hypothetical protein